MNDDFLPALVTILVGAAFILTFFLGRAFGVGDVAQSCQRYEAFYQGDNRFVCRALLIEESR